jgi:hypothetical protein
MEDWGGTALRSIIESWGLKQHSEQSESKIISKRSNPKDRIGIRKQAENVK